MTRKHVVVESFGGGTVKIKDGISPFLKSLALEHPKAAQRAIRHVGFTIQDDLKTGIREGKAGRVLIQPQEQLSPKAKRRIQSDRITSTYKTTTKSGKTVERKRTRYKNRSGTDVSQHIRRKRRFAGRVNSRTQNLLRAIGYQLKSDQVVIGWLSHSAAVLGELVQEGQTINVTEKMRNYFHAIGLSLAEDTHQIVMKPNPFVLPYFNANRKTIARRFRKRFYRNLTPFITRARL